VTLRIAHLTDVHLPLPVAGPAALLALPRRCGLAPFLGKRASGLVSWALRRSFRHRAALLATVREDVAAFRPHLVLVTGDLVHLALAGEFAAARRWLGELARLAPVHLVPGNHDAYVAGALEAHGGAWADWTHGRVAHDDYPWSAAVGPLLLIGLSTAVPRPVGDAGGRLGAAQCARARRLLAAAAEAVRIVLLHHPPLPVGPRRRALEDRGAFAAVVREVGAELVLCGHEHRALKGALAGPAGPVPVLVGPSASLAEPGRRGGWLALELDPRHRTLRVTLRRFDGRGLVSERRPERPLPPARVREGAA